MIKRLIILMFFSSIFAQFEVTINSTGESHLVVFLDSVTGLDVGDQIGLI